MITDKYIEKNDDKFIKKVQLLYIDGDKKLCDGCDEKKKCASIVGICGDVMIMCKDCLMEIVNKFEDKESPQITLEEFKKTSDEFVKSMTKESAIEFLKEIGLLDSDGNVIIPFKNEE